MASKTVALSLTGLFVVFLVVLVVVQVLKPHEGFVNHDNKQMMPSKPAVKMVKN